MLCPRWFQWERINGIQLCTHNEMQNELRCGHKTLKTTKWTNCDGNYAKKKKTKTEKWEMEVLNPMKWYNIEYGQQACSNDDKTSPLSNRTSGCNRMNNANRHRRITSTATKLLWSKYGREMWWTIKSMNVYTNCHF